MAPIFTGQPQGLSESVFAVLRSHGLKSGELMEIMAMAALAVYADITADATAMEPDAMFVAVQPEPYACSDGLSLRRSSQRTDRIGLLRAADGTCKSNRAREFGDG
jgi:hypothetical protein